VFKVAEACSVTPQFSRFNSVLYESSLVNFGMYLFDCNKKAISFQDIYSKSVKLNEGEYTLHAQICSENVSTLQQLKKSILLLNFAMAKPMELSFYKSLADTFVPSATPLKKSITLENGSGTCLFVSDFNKDVPVPKGAKPGDFLIGDFKLNSDLSIDGLFKATYAVGSELVAKDDEFLTDKEAVKTQSVQLSESVRDLEIGHMSKLTKDELSTLLAKLEKENSKSIKLHKKKLECMLEEFEKTPAPSAEQLITAANQALSLIDESAVALYFGVQQDPTSTSQKQKTLKAEFQEKKETIALAYVCIASVYRYQISTSTAEEGKLNELFDAALLKSSQWTSDALNDGNYVLLWAWKESQKGYPATALKPLLKYVSNSNNVSKSKWKKAIEQRNELVMKLE
jgi:tripeptidyl-peptidase II